jgi:arylsulfatase
MTTWEGGWRVAGIVRWPGKVRAGETSDGIAATIDLLPTFAKVAGASAPSGAAKAATTFIDGLDLTSFLTQPGAPSPRETFLYHNGARLTAVRHKDFKLVFARPAGGEMSYMPNFVTSHIEELPSPQLYQLSTDPTESTDVSAKRPNVMKLLTTIATKSRADLGDHTGPGSGARFFDEGPNWPKAAEPKLARPQKRQQTK